MSFTRFGFREFPSTRPPGHPPLGKCTPAPLHGAAALTSLRNPAQISIRKDNEAPKTPGRQNPQECRQAQEASGKTSRAGRQKNHGQKAGQESSEALNPRWNGNEALFCRRVKASKAIEARHKKVWLDATFETLELKPEAPPPRMRGDPLLDTGQRAFWRATLAGRNYFEGDDYSLSMKLDGRVEGVAFGEALALPEAVKRIDAAMAAMELQAAGDFSFDVPGRIDPVEYTVRVYTGARDFFASVSASTESFEVFLFSRVNGRWVLTGTIDEDDAGRITAERPRLSMVGSEDDEGTPLADMVEAHEEHLAKFDGEADEIPDTLQGIAALYDDYLTAVLG